MSRLTIRKNGIALIEEIEYEPCGEVCDRTSCFDCPVGKATEKLAHYEDLEEQGRLIEQKYGYLMQSRDYDEDDGSYTIRKECSVCGMAFTPMFFKPAYCPSCGAKLVTKEEAEARLNELQNNDGI